MPADQDPHQRRLNDGNSNSNSNNNGGSSSSSSGNGNGNGDASPSVASTTATNAAATIRTASPTGKSLSSRSFRSSHAAGGNGLDASGVVMSAEQWRTVRTMPTWVQRREEDEEDSIILPPRAHRRPPERSVHDAQREATPVTPSHSSQHANRWKNYLEYTTAYPPNTSHSEKVSEDWLAQQGDLDSPWLASNRVPDNAGDGAVDDQEALWGSKKKRRIWYKRIHIILLNSPIVPLTFRAAIWIVSLLALALAGSIFYLSRSYNFDQKPSTIMAIIVDATALVYLIYITFDEYSGKPVGLRSPKAKIRLLMCDLLFIIFDSANLSLAFDTLYDVRWSCRSAASSQDFGPDSINSTRTVDPICDRQRALAAFLFLALCGWVATFMVSVFRVVERVSARA